MSRKVLVAGVGMIPFSKPGTSPSYTEMGSQAVRQALADGGVDFSTIQTAFAGYVYGDSTSGQTAIYEVGRSGIPIFNVNNNCASGSSALYLARQAVESGQVDCALALGFEQMQAGALKNFWDDRPVTRARFRHVLEDLTNDVADLPQALRTFGGAGREHMERYGTSLEAFAAVRAKASRHAANNPFAVFRKVVSTEDVLNDKVMWPGVMTRLMACPPTCGAAAAILVSEDFAARHNLRTDVRIIDQEITTDEAISFDPPSMISYAGYYMSKTAADRLYERSGYGPSDIKAVELHDCFAHNELISYEALGFCGEGEGEKFVMDGQNTYGGQVVTNPSGGLLSKGHPLGATGLAQCFELTNQLRGTAGARQVENLDVALQHNIGLGGACVVTLYGKN